MRSLVERVCEGKTFKIKEYDDLFNELKKGFGIPTYEFMSRYFIYLTSIPENQISFEFRESDKLMNGIKELYRNKISKNAFAFLFHIYTNVKQEIIAKYAVKKE